MKRVLEPLYLIGILTLTLIAHPGCSDEEQAVGQPDAGDTALADQPEELPEGDPESDLDEPSDLPPPEDATTEDSDDDLDTVEDEPDLVTPPDRPLQPITEPVPFRVAATWGRVPAPIGIGTTGYGPSLGPVSPFADRYPATTREVFPLQIQVIALEGGLNRLILINMDFIGVGHEVHQRIADELRRRTGLDLFDSIIIGATHTHSGPGRLSTHPGFELAADRFWPQYNDRIVGFVAELVLEAFDELQEGRFGYDIIQDNSLGSDRRCETPEMMTGIMTVLRFDDLEGRPIAGALSYPTHGIIYSSNDYAIAADAPGCMRAKIQERFEHQVPILFFNSWGGDVTPRRGSVGEPHEGMTRKQLQCEELGERAADIFMPVYSAIETFDDVAVGSATALIEFGMEPLGYTEDEWWHLNGALWCGAGADVPCWGEGDPPSRHDLVNACLPIFGRYVFSYTAIAVGHIGELALAAFPGEPCTQVGLNVVEGVREISGYEDVWFLGFAQDHCNYSETEEYWYRGGYETSGTVWGPRQGDYITESIVALADRFFNDSESLPLWVADTPSFEIPPDARADYETEPSTNLGQIILDAPETLSQGSAVFFSFLGGDPWLTTPRVELEQLVDESWLPVTRNDGSVVANDRYEFETRLEVSNPTYRERRSWSEREFEWTVVLPTHRGYGPLAPMPTGAYRLSVRGEARVEDEIVDYELSSQAFTLTEWPLRE